MQSTVPIQSIERSLICVFAPAAPAITKEKITIKKLNRWLMRFSMKTRSWLISHEQLDKLILSPLSASRSRDFHRVARRGPERVSRSEEHTSELQSLRHLV